MAHDPNVSGKGPSGINRRDFLRWAAILGAGAASTMFMGCGPKQQAPPTAEQPKPAPAPAPKPAEPVKPQFPRGTMRILQGVDAESMDPHVTTSGASKGIMWTIYDKLAERDPAMNIIPWLATSWKVLADDLWELKLRDDVKFHNGEKFTAETAKASIERFVDPEIKNVYASQLKPVIGMKVVDDYTLQIQTDGPYAILMEVLSMYCEMLPMAIIRGEVDPGVNCIGSGAYKFVEWIPGERAVCEAAEEHFSAQPRMEKLIWRPVPEATTRVVELKTGGAELAASVPSIQVSEIPDMVQSIPITGANFIVLNCSHPAMSDVRVRHAMNYAVDKEGIIKTLMRGFADQTSGPCGFGMPGYDPDLPPYPHDPDKAKSLLREAGMGDGFEMELVSPDGRYPNDKMVSEAIAAQWTAVGIKTSVRVMEWGAFVQGVLGREFDGYFFRQGGAMADSTVRLNFHSTATNGRGPWHGYVNAEVDDIIDTAVKTMDAEKREGLYRKLNQLVRDDAPWVYLYQYHDIYGVGKSVKQFEPRPDAIIVLNEMHMDV